MYSPNWSRSVNVTLQGDAYYGGDSRVQYLEKLWNLHSSSPCQSLLHAVNDGEQGPGSTEAEHETATISGSKCTLVWMNSCCGLPFGVFRFQPLAFLLSSPRPVYITDIQMKHSEEALNWAQLSMNEGKETQVKLEKNESMCFSSDSWFYVTCHFSLASEINCLLFSFLNF